MFLRKKMLLQLLSDVSGIRVGGRREDKYLPKIEVDWLRFCTFSVSMAGTYYIALKLLQGAGSKNGASPTSRLALAGAAAGTTGGAVGSTTVAPAAAAGSTSTSPASRPDLVTTQVLDGGSRILVPLSEFLDMVARKLVTAVSYDTDSVRPDFGSLTFEVDKSAQVVPPAIDIVSAAIPDSIASLPAAEPPPATPLYSTVLVPGCHAVVFAAIQAAGIPHAAGAGLLGGGGGGPLASSTTTRRGGSAGKRMNKDVAAALAVDLITLTLTLAFCYWYYEQCNPLSTKNDDSGTPFFRKTTPESDAGGGSTAAGGAAPDGGAAAGDGRPRGICFADVAGFKKQKQELREVIEYVRNPDSFRMLGAVPPLGTLLVGPPGCGKTLLARAVATEAGVPFFHASASGFVEKYVGVGASRVRRFFASAQQYQASILFLDELEALGSRDDQLGSGEYCQTISQLLVELDGMHMKRSAAGGKSSTATGSAGQSASGSSSVSATFSFSRPAAAKSDSESFFVFLAATNRAHTLDPALLRPGRLDRIVRIRYPAQKTRAECIRIHAKGKALDPELFSVESNRGERYVQKLARRCRGRSCAEIAHLMNEAALLAARRRSPCITWDDLKAACDVTGRRNTDFASVGISSDEEEQDANSPSDAEDTDNLYEEAQEGDAGASTATGGESQNRAPISAAAGALQEQAKRVGRGRGGPTTRSSPGGLHAPGLLNTPDQQMNMAANREAMRLLGQLLIQSTEVGSGGSTTSRST